MRKISVLLFVCFSFVAGAQEHPFSQEILTFQRQDSIKPPKENAIVFVGSSSFRMWKNVQDDFPGHVIINRGFGGSSLPHVITYADEIIIPYKPKQVVIYCGDNDFMADDVTSEIVTDRFKELFRLLREEIPGVRIVYVSIKPSPSRQHLMPQMAAANASIRDFLEGEKRTAFVNIWDPMLNENGAPRKELFLTDMLHMNERGYAIWQDAIAPHLE